MRLPNFITSRSTQFGFAIVLILCAALVWMLFVQLDTWSRASFGHIKNNTQQAQLIISMRDAVQKREMIIQRMMHMREKSDIENETIKFVELAANFAQTREKLVNSIQLDSVLVASLRRLDDAVSYSQPFQDNLVEALIYEEMNEADTEAIFWQGRMAAEKVLFLLDKMVERQSFSYEKVIDEYERSRRYTLLGVFGVFSLVVLVIFIAVRTSTRQFSHVSRLSIIDDVSGIYNRRYFDMVLEEEWKRSMRENTELSLLMLDIDYFKAYNDSFGHQMGDECLFSVGKILTGQLKRASDFAARYGGEEFVIVLPNTHMEQACLLAEKLRRSVEEARIKSGDDTVSSWLTMSVGVACKTAEFGQEYSDLVNAADSCLYESKRAGRNRVSDRIVEEQV